MEKKELFTRIGNLKNEIKELKNKLDQANKDKESWFNKKESLKNEIKELIKNFKSVKQEKDNLNTEIKKFRD